MGSILAPFILQHGYLMKLFNLIPHSMGSRKYYMNKHLASRIVVSALLSFFSSISPAQSLQSTSGTPLVSKCDYCIASEGISPIDAGSSGVRYDFRYLRDQDIFQDGKKIGNDHGDMETYVTHQLSFYYQIDNAFSVMLHVPFASRSESGEGTPPRLVDTARTVAKQTSQHHLEDHPYANIINGLSDVILMARYKIINEKEAPFFLCATAGVKLPTGSTDSRDIDNNYLNPHMQLGTGSVDPLLGLSAMYGVNDYSLSAALLVALPSKGVRDYQFGTNLNYDLTFRYNLIQMGAVSTLFASIGMNGEWHGREKQSGSEVANTGGNTTYIAPGLQFLVTTALSLEASYQYPFIHSLIGKQLGETYRFSGGIQYVF